MMVSKTLEFDIIRNVLSDIAKMDINKEKFQDLDIINNKDAIQHMLYQVDEFSQILLRYGNIDLYDLGDISSSVNRASKGSILSILELFNILSSFKMILEIEKYSLSVDKQEFIEYYNIIYVRGEE